MCSCQDSMATRCRSSLLLGHASSRRHYHTIVQIDIDSLCSQLVLVTGFQLVHKFLNSFTLFFCQGLCLLCWPNIHVFSIVCCQLIFIPIFIVIAGSSAFVWSSTMICSFALQHALFFAQLCLYQITQFFISPDLNFFFPL